MSLYPEEFRKDAVALYRGAAGNRTYAAVAADLGITAESLRTWVHALHWMLQGHHSQRTAGQWRKTSIRITAPGDELATDYDGPDPELVPGLMAELVDWLNDGDTETHFLIRAAMAHLNLVKVHPWSDGNAACPAPCRLCWAPAAASWHPSSPRSRSGLECPATPGSTTRYCGK